MGASEARRKARRAALHEAAVAQFERHIETRTYRSRISTVVICFLLVAATILSYQGVRHNDFLSYDDTDYVLQNRQVQQGLTVRSIAWAFTSFHCSNWHPLTWISHMVDWRLYGDKPAGHHVTSVVLHAANAVLLFLLLLSMTGFAGRSAMVAFLFALHPLHVESVAWIAERKDVLSAFFWLATMLCYVRYVRRKNSRKWFLAVIAGFACGLMAKPMTVTLPFTLLLLDFWPLRRTAVQNGTVRQRATAWGRLCVEKWPLFLMTIVSSCITFYAQKTGGAVTQLEALPLWTRFGNAALSYCRYLAKMVWPDPLMAYYHHESRHIAVPLVLMLAVFLALVTAGCWFVRAKRPYCLAGWLWYLGTLVPVIGIVQVGVQAMAERYTYVPLIGIFVAMVWMIGETSGKIPKIKFFVHTIAVAAIVAMAAKTHAQVNIWKNTVTLFRNVIENDPRGEFPNLTLGAAYMREGNISPAQRFLERALEYNPSGPQTLSYYSFCLMQTHQPEKLPIVRQCLERALRSAPDNRDAMTNMAEWCLTTGSPAEAEGYCRKVLAASPDFITARFYLADALQEQNRLPEAAQEYRNALAAEPDNTDAHNNLGIILGKQGLSDDALGEFKKALAIKPDQAMAHSNIGRVLMETNHVPEAVHEFTEALRYDSTNAVAHNNLGVALFQQGDYTHAAEHFSRSVQIDSSYADAQKNLRLAQARLQTAAGGVRKK